MCSPRLADKIVSGRPRRAVTRAVAIMALGLIQLVAQSHAQTGHTYSCHAMHATATVVSFDNENCAGTGTTETYPMPTAPDLWHEGANCTGKDAYGSSGGYWCDIAGAPVTYMMEYFHGSQFCEGVAVPYRFTSANCSTHPGSGVSTQMSCVQNHSAGFWMQKKSGCDSSCENCAEVDPHTAEYGVCQQDSDGGGSHMHHCGELGADPNHGPETAYTAYWEDSDSCEGEPEKNEPRVTCDIEYGDSASCGDNVAKLAADSGGIFTSCALESCTDASWVHQHVIPSDASAADAEALIASTMKWYRYVCKDTCGLCVKCTWDTLMDALETVQPGDEAQFLTSKAELVSACQSFAADRYYKPIKVKSECNSTAPVCDVVQLIAEMSSGTWLQQSTPVVTTSAVESGSWDYEIDNITTTYDICKAVRADMCMG